MESIPSWLFVSWGVLFIGCFAGGFILKRMNNAAAQKFQDEHPDHMKLYLGEGVTVFKVDGADARIDDVGRKRHIFVPIGKSRCLANFTTTGEKGVVRRRTETRTTDKISVRIATEQGVNYELNFDEERNSFKLKK